MLKLMLPLVAATWVDAFRRVRNRIALVAAAICVAAAPLSSFAAAKSATLKATGYSGSTLTGFQVLVKLSASNDAYGFSYAEAGGASHYIWFTSADGATVYPHEIDKWNTSGDSFVWVRLPELASGTTFKMHWSDSASDVQSASGNVWDGYVGVWHMNETGTTAEPDSTGHGLNAAPINNSSASTSINTDTNGGQIGNGRAVSQASMFKVSGHASHISEAKTFTIGGWVKRTGTGDYPRIFVGNPNNSTRTKWEVYGWSATELIARGGDKDFTRNVNLSTSAGWKYLTVVYTGTTATIYDNGAPVGNAGAINNAVQDSYFTIGAVSGANNRSFVGTFDEVRMYNGAMTADRVAADYATMNDPTTFLTLVPAAQSATLTHRWSFNSNDKDEITGADPASRFGTRNISDGQVHFTGNSWGGGSLSLGTGSLGSGDATVEIWATQDAVRNNSVIFSYSDKGWGTAPTMEACMQWTSGTDINKDALWLSKDGANKLSRQNTMAPYTLGKEYHIAMTFRDNGDGSSSVHWQRRDASTGMLEKEGNAVVDDWTLSTLTASTATFAIGVWKTNIAKDACASYNEVRIWNGVLGDDQLAANASMGPDAYASGLTEGFELAAGTKFNVPEGGYTASGAVTLGAGAKLRFDTASFHGQSITFSATGFNVPSGSILDYVELTDSANFTATLSGNTITVERTAAAPVDYFVDWVQPSAALYVDTEVIGKAGTKIELKMLNVSSGTWPVMLGSWKDGNDAGRFNIAMFNGEVTRWEYAGTLDQNGLRYAPYTCELTFEVEYTTAGVMNGKWSGCARPESGSVGSATVSTTKTVNNGKVLNTGLNMYLFACNKMGSPEQTHLGRLYYCKIWQVPDGGSDYVLVRDFHPCVKDGVAGLYDSVSRTIFYPPASGNALNAGPATFDPATCPSDSRVGSVDHTSTLFGRIAYSGDRSGMSGASNWRLIGLNDYTLKGAGDTANLNGANTTWQNNNLRHAQLRFDGWFQVDSSKAGTWTINQGFDDYFAFFIDTNLVLYNNSYTAAANATVDVAEGWHRFTIVAGDTYGGYGSGDRGDGVGSVPLKVTVGGNAYAFNNTNFPQGSGSNSYTLTSDEDWSDRGPIILTGGAVLDLNGHTLVVKDIACDDYVGSCITNSAAAKKSVIFFTGTPAETKAYKDGLIKQIDEKIILAHNGDQVATWTGAVSGDPTNANNWEDLAGQPVVPTAAHAVKIVGSNVNLQCPAGMDIACKSFEIGNCTFTANCDWSGLSQTPTIDGTAKRRTSTGMSSSSATSRRCQVRRSPAATDRLLSSWSMSQPRLQTSTSTPTSRTSTTSRSPAARTSVSSRRTAMGRLR